MGTTAYGVLRFWNHEVLTELDAVLRAIAHALEHRLEEMEG